MGRPPLCRETLDPAGVAVAVSLLFLPALAIAAPEQRNCTLTQIESTADPDFSQPESRSIGIIIDKMAKTIAVSQGGAVHPLDHVTFSQLTMNGYTDSISLGIDTSSGTIVFQSYGPNSNKIEFGICSLK